MYLNQIKTYVVLYGNLLIKLLSGEALLNHLPYGGFQVVLPRMKQLMDPIK